MKKFNIAVIGAGSWGTALALRLAYNGHRVTLCCYDDSHRQLCSSQRENSYFLPGIKFPDNLDVRGFNNSDIDDCNYCLIAVPSVGFTNAISIFKKNLQRIGSVIWATKGMDPISGKLLSSYVKDYFPQDFQYGVLTGPSFALEVGKSLPTAVCVASSSNSFSKKIQDLFHCSLFRMYICDDIIGAQIGGAIKNVIAISTGVSDGLKYGANSRAALITRGLAEIQRLGVKFGADPKTFMGLTGMGDLVLTCTDNQSRNRRFGLFLGDGDSIKQAMSKINQVVEGYETVKTVYHLASKLNVEMPITESIYKILYENIPAKEAVNNLLSREAKKEF